MKGPSNERLRKPSSATPLCPASPLGSSKLKILCVLSGSGENRLVSVDRHGGIGLAKLRARLAAFAPPGAPFFLRYELPPLPGAVPLAGEEDVERMVAAHDRLAAKQGRCPRVRVYLLDVGPISPTTVLQGGAVLGDLNDRNPKRWPDPSQLDSCGVCCSPPAVGNRAELLRRNGGFHGGIALPWSHLATGAHSNKRQLQYGFTGASCGRARKYENGWGGVANRGIGFEASNAHAGARRRWGNAKTSNPKAYQQQSLVSPINSTIQRAAVADSNNSPFSPCIGTVGMDSEAVVKKSMSRLLNSLLEQVSLEAKKELDHINSNNAGNNANLTNILDVSSKEVVEDPQRIPAAYTLLASQELQTIQNSDLEELRQLGSGRYGTVFYGKWRGSDVAIKRLRSSCFSGGNLGEEKMVTDFWKEARLLGQLHHPNVVAFYGVVSDGPVTSLAIATEYMVNGSLKQVMRRKDRTIDRRKRLIIAMDAAFGMEYLHEKNVVHFDLKSHNLFVNIKDPQRPICKIGDLGLSKVKQHTLVSGGIRGTIPWMAPELFSSRNNMVTDKVDVYSFGIIMWELLTGEGPYENMPTEEILAGILKGDLRPAVPHWCDPDWRSLMERCWSSSPDARPSFSEVARELRTIAASMNIK